MKNFEILRDTDFFFSVLPVNVFLNDSKEGSNMYELQLDLPGLGREDISADLDDSRTVVITRTHDNCVLRRWMLPKDADEKTISASMKNGRLKMSVEKKKNKVRKIEIT